MRALIPIAILLSFATSADGADEPVAKAKSNTLTGRFVFDGDAPQPELLTLNKDIEYCGKHKPRDESLVVDAKTRGIRNVVVWLDAKSSGRKPKFSPPAKDQPAARMDNHECRFAPRVSIAQAGRPLRLANKDKISHAMQIHFFVNDPLNLTLNTTEAGAGVTITPEFAEPTPAKVVCPLHPWMQGWIVVQEHPFVAVTDEQGRFEIANLPPGDWTFRMWHETAGYVDEGTRDTKPEKWDRGRIKIKMGPGDNALGEIRLGPKAFEPDTE